MTCWKPLLTRKSLGASLEEGRTFMFIRANLPAIIWALIILVLMLMPGQHVPRVDKYFLPAPDKFAHVFVFMLLVFLMIRGFRKQSRFFGLRKRAVQFSIMIAGIYSLILESLQLISPERTVDVFDATANLGGCLLGLIVYKMFYS